MSPFGQGEPQSRALVGCLDAKWRFSLSNWWRKRARRGKGAGPKRLIDAGTNEGASRGAAGYENVVPQKHRFEIKNEIVGRGLKARLVSTKGWRPICRR